MVEFVDHLLGFISGLPPEWGLLFLFCAAMIEYVFPPFPGDLVVLFGAFAVGTGLYPLPSAFACITAGSFTGMVVLYIVGRRLSPSYQLLRRKKHIIFSSRLMEQAEKGFLRWGDWLIFVNRFLPALRSVVFLSAGLLRRPPLRVILLGTSSLFLWNSFLMFLGYELGQNWMRLRSFLAVYNRVVGILIVLGIALWLAFELRSARKKTDEQTTHPRS